MRDKLYVHYGSKLVQYLSLEFFKARVEIIIELLYLSEITHTYNAPGIKSYRSAHHQSGSFGKGNMGIKVRRDIHGKGHIIEPLVV